MYASGNFYEGDWNFDKKKGFGTMNWVTIKEKYYGNWDDNRQNGLGVHIWLESKGEGKYLRNRYDGEWDSGQRHGFGTFYYANGSKYEGSWNRNCKEGYALFTDEIGKQRFAIFKDDKILREFDTAKKKKPIIEQIEGNYESNLEIVNDILSPDGKKGEGLSPLNKSKYSPMKKTKTRLTSGKKAEHPNENPDNKY